MEKFKSFFGFDEDIDEDYIDYNEVSNSDSIQNESDSVRVVEKTNRAPQREAERRVATRPTSGYAQTGGSNMPLTICIHEPQSYDEAPKIVDDLRLRKAVVLNFEQLDQDIKRNVFDFVNGSLYSLDGKIQKVNKDIFILAPSNVEIEGLKGELQEKGVFPW